MINWYPIIVSQDSIGNFCYKIEMLNFNNDTHGQGYPNVKFIIDNFTFVMNEDCLYLEYDLKWNYCFDKKPKVIDVVFIINYVHHYEMLMMTHN